MDQSFTILDPDLQYSRMFTSEKNR